MYKNRFTLLLLFLFVNIFLSCGLALSRETSAREDLTDIFNEMEIANTAFKTMKADIVYTRTIALLEYTEVSHGEISYKKPRRLYLKFAPPRDEINIIDEKHIWIYRPAKKQVEKYDAGSSDPSRGTSFLDFGYGSAVGKIRKDYDITLLDTKEEGKKWFYLLDLSPRDPRSHYSNIRLWVEEGFWLPNKIELYESDGEIVNIIELKNIKLNKSISDKLFRFDVPRGVEVIEPFH
ncbi:MAG: LolA family protein [Candidatus Loosdrechtia sp.]|uniref:LolA family protein n=1 Tax=Candidatus Loosdrechtia sp. TaxID=3101272 RepID=UPI003A65D356|nr:MAG: outer membrane lipoprotein carrier protein LolA [Candidatus Jettenia sp. AMX2]